MIVEALTPTEWKELSRNAHLVCFNEIKDENLERIDFALMTSDHGTPLSYMTCRELDGESVYLQYGGAFPSSKGTVVSFKSYLLMLSRLKEMGYKIAGTYIENTNTAMIKFALKAGWLITGVRTFKGSILLELQMHFEGV